MCGHRARSRADSGDERVNGGGGRHRHPLRGGGIGSAAVDVLAGWLQRHAGQLGNSTACINAPACWRGCGNGSPASLSTNASRAAPAVGWNGCAGRTTSNQGVGLLDHLGYGRVHVMGACVGCSIATLLATTHRDRVAGMVLYSPAGGPKYRRRQHARFAAHLAYVAEHGLTGVAALARATEAGFSDDGRVGPWVSVLRSDAEFAARYVELDVDRYQTIVAGMSRLLFDRDTVPGCGARRSLGTGHSGAHRARAGQLARAVGGALPPGMPARCAVLGRAGRGADR